MTIDTVSLSDIGKSLIEIESEITSNNNNIEYYIQCMERLKEKNEALVSLSRSLILFSIPNTSTASGKY